MKEEKQLKIWHSVILLMLVGCIVFFISSLLYYYMGFYGTAIGEILMGLLAILTTVLAGAKLKPVFQFRKPELRKIFGTIFLWIGSYLITMVVAVIMEFFFPVQMMEAGSSLEAGILTVDLLPAILIVSLSPAICEELVFRGVLFNSIWNKSHRKWLTIIVVGVIFGAFHGSVWRFVPTCILGIVMGYILFETNNMFYNMLFHGINNAVPVLLLFAAGTTGSDITSEIEAVGNDLDAYRDLLSSGMGLYMLIGALGVFVFYVGRKMIRQVNPSTPPEVIWEKEENDIH